MTTNPYDVNNTSPDIYPNPQWDVDAMQESIYDKDPQLAEEMSEALKTPEQQSEAPEYSLDEIQNLANTAQNDQERSMYDGWAKELKTQEITPTQQPDWTPTTELDLNRLEMDSDPAVRQLAEAARAELSDEHPTTEEPSLEEQQRIQTQEDQQKINDILAQINSSEQNPPHEDMAAFVDKFTTDPRMIQEALMILDKSHFPSGNRMGIMTNIPALMEYISTHPGANEEFAEGIRAIKRIQDGQA